MTNNGKNKEWLIKKTDYLLKTKWLAVRKDAVIMPTGTEMEDFYILEYPNWVNVIAITEDDCFVIERQYRHGLQITSYEICAGVVEKGESALLAAQRELLEETGYGDGEWELYMTSAPNPSAMTNMNYTFIAKCVKKIANQNLEKSEDIDVLLVTKDELKTLMLKGEIMQGIMLAPLWRWMSENNRTDSF